ncbi:FAD:protein FMN transferase [Curtobacterium sp. VKM Ac-1395]|nr:FAD:protein FMN transferase [Curtobacterium sp. VKM Ac-1395]
MGTVVSVRGATAADAAAVRAVFASYDCCYSLYDPTSVMSRVAAGSLRLADTPTEVRDAYALALEWRDRTGGAFTPHRPDGVIDLSGIVKGLAVRDAGAVLDVGATADGAATAGGPTGNWMVSAGGDVLVRGNHGEDDPWSVGIVDPARRDTVVGVVRLDVPRRAVATSGTAERGEHIWRRADPTFVQASVIADDIVTADVLATAIIAGDADDLRRLTSDTGIDVLAFGADGTVWATPGARSVVLSEDEETCAATSPSSDE